MNSMQSTKQELGNYTDFFIVRLRGGLGNQLFQYAAARMYSIKTGRPFKADISGYANPEAQKVPRGYKLENFNLVLDIATKGKVPTGFTQ
jgi:hypothetical protein